jgi:hypothetical protein
MALSWEGLFVLEPEAVTIRPDMGREQVAQAAVGTPARDDELSQGNRDVDFVGERFGGMVLEGRGKGRALFSIELLESLETSIVGGAEGTVTEISGVVPASAILILGIGGVSLFATGTTWSSSGRLIVGTVGAETVAAGIIGLGWMVFLWIGSSRWGESSVGCHVFSKLTIGRPGTSLTAVGVGSFGLRSFSRMVVAARISSLRISIPSFDVGASTSGMNSIIGFVGVEFAVYAALRDWLGGFLWISKRSSFVLSGVVLDRSGRGREPLGKELRCLFCNGISSSAG